MTTHQLLEAAIQACKTAQIRATNYQTCRDTYPPGNPNRSDAYKQWVKAQDDVSRAMTAWQQALTLETQDRGVRK